MFSPKQTALIDAVVGKHTARLARDECCFPHGILPQNKQMTSESVSLDIRC